MTIKGGAQSQDVKDRVGAKVRSVEGVQDAVNDLQVKLANEPSAKNAPAHSRQAKRHTK